MAFGVGACYLFLSSTAIIYGLKIYWNEFNLTALNEVTNNTVVVNKSILNIIKPPGYFYS
jgi:hypothetical protein